MSIWRSRKCTPKQSGKLRKSFRIKMRKKMTMPCNTVFQADFESAVGFRWRCLVFVASVLLFRAFVLHFALATKLLIFMTEKSCLNDSPRQNTTFSHLVALLVAFNAQ